MVCRSSAGKSFRPTEAPVGVRLDGSWWFMVVRRPEVGRAETFTHSSFLCTNVTSQSGNKLVPSTGGTEVLQLCTQVKE